MKKYIAIVRTENSRIAKYLDFDTQSKADAHIQKYGGFVYNNSAGTPIRDLWIDGQTVTVVPREPSVEELKQNALRAEYVKKRQQEEQDMLMNGVTPEALAYKQKISR